MTHVTPPTIIDVYTRAHAHAYTAIMSGSVTSVTAGARTLTAKQEKDNRSPGRVHNGEVAA